MIVGTLPAVRRFIRSDTSRVAQFLSEHFADVPSSAWEQTLTHALWSNPSVAPSASLGWVLEDSSEGIVGFLGNVPHPFHVIDHEVRAAATTAWCVAPRFRSQGLLLAEAFLEQEDVDLLFNTTANAVAGELFTRLGFQRVHVESLGDVLYWITNPARFLRGALTHVTGSAALATAAAIGGALPLMIVEAVRAMPGRHTDHSGKVARTATFTDEWQTHWSSWRSGLITGVRTPVQLAWRLGGDDTRTMVLRDGTGRSLGYISCRKLVDYAGALVRVRVVDLWAEPGRDDVVRTLIGAARALASEWRCACVEVFGTSDAIRSALAPLRPRVRRLASWPYYVRAGSRDLKSALQSGRWHATEYDGDSSFSVGAV